MKMNETLHNCLMAVASRDPYSIVDIDKDAWGSQSEELHAQTPLALLDQLQICAPQFLNVSAQVEYDGSSCEIGVVDLSQHRMIHRM